MNQPIYRDGKPQNLEAAALDALEWLRLMQEYIAQIRGQAATQHRLEKDRDALVRCIAAIESFVVMPEIHAQELTPSFELDRMALAAEIAEDEKNKPPTPKPVKGIEGMVKEIKRLAKSKKAPRRTKRKHGEGTNQ